MATQEQTVHEVDGISDSDFSHLCELVRSRLGVAISPAKRVMVETRLRKRARALGLESISSYCRLVYGEGGRQEWPSLVDAITTHKTDFFREPVHFEYLVRDALPELAACHGSGVGRPLAVWSAACSTGEEPYTLAMVISEYCSSIEPVTYRFRIHATDISEGVLETARNAVYPESAIVPVPSNLRSRYLLRSKDPQRRTVRMAPAIRALVEFRQLNLMDAGYGFNEPLDVVFCRNVLIYFDRSTQQRVLGHICRTLQCGGYLFMGHAESLNGLDLPLSQIAPTVYRRVNG